MTKLVKNNTHQQFSRRILLLALAYLFSCILNIPNVLAIGLSKKNTTVYTYESKNGVTSFSDIAPIQQIYHTYRFDCFACGVDSLVDWHTATLYLTPYQDTINNAAKVNNIAPALVRAIIHAESHFNPKAISKQGAQGLMQLMPRTAQSLGVKNPLDSKQNIYGGVRHLARLLTKYKGNHKVAAAAYNAGEGAVKKYSGIPPFPETEVYVQRVDILFKRYLVSNLK